MKRNEITGIIGQENKHETLKLNATVVMLASIAASKSDLSTEEKKMFERKEKGTLTWIRNVNYMNVERRITVISGKMRAKRLGKFGRIV